MGNFIDMRLAFSDICLLSDQTLEEIQMTDFPKLKKKKDKPFFEQWICSLFH